MIRKTKTTTTYFNLSSGPMEVSTDTDHASYVIVQRKNDEDYVPHSIFNFPKSDLPVAVELLSELLTELKGVL